MQMRKLADSHQLVIDRLDTRYVAEKLGYTSHRCVLDNHRKDAGANYLREWDGMWWYRCWPCGVNLPAYRLIKAYLEATNEEIDGAATLEAKAFTMATEMVKEREVDQDWVPDESLYEGTPGEPGSGRHVYTLDEMVEYVAEAQARAESEDDPFADYATERSERTWPESFDSFKDVDADWIASEFGWGLNHVGSLVIPLREGDELVGVRIQNAWKKWSLTGSTTPVFYGMDRDQGQQRIVIVEGCADTVRMAWEFRDDPDTLVVGTVSAAFNEKRLTSNKGVVAGRDVVLLGDAGDAGSLAVEKLVTAFGLVANSVAIVPTPEGYADVCGYEGDLRALVGKAQIVATQAYLDRPTVQDTIARIRQGMGYSELLKVLRALPPVPLDQAEQAVILAHLKETLKGVGLTVGPAEAWMKSVEREDPEYEKAVLREELDSEPWPDEVDGPELLEEAADRFRTYVRLPADFYYDVLPLWDLHTYCYSSWKYTPYVFATAPTRGCGKSRLSDVASMFARMSQKGANVSPAALYRYIEAFHPTFFIDETENIFTRENMAGDFVGVINSGFEIDGCVIRTVGENFIPTAFSTFGPKFLSGIGHLTATVEDRSIVIQMRKKVASDEVARLTNRVRRSLEEPSRNWRRRATRWVADNQAALDEVDVEALDPELFAMIEDDRMLDVWEPLLSIGHVVGGGWYERIREALIAYSAIEHEEQDTNLLLLEHVARYFEVANEDVTLVKLAGWLNGIDDAPWSSFGRGMGLTTRTLAKVLRSFGVETDRVGHDGDRGYRASNQDLQDAMARYLP